MYVFYVCGCIALLAFLCIMCLQFPQRPEEDSGSLSEPGVRSHLGSETQTLVV